MVALFRAIFGAKDVGEQGPVPNSGVPHFWHKTRSKVYIPYQSESDSILLEDNDLTRHCISETKLCPVGLRYDPCSTCTSCETIRDCDKKNCVPGCVCPEGLVTESINSRECIEPGQCACLDKDNVSHPPNSAIHKGCIKW